MQIKKLLTNCYRKPASFLIFTTISLSLLQRQTYAKAPGDDGGTGGGGSGAVCDGTTQAGLQECLKQNPIVHDIQLVVNFLSAGVGVVVVAVIILGGIQYALAGDNPQAVSAAKQRIINGLIALLAFMFTFAFLQWLIPGGIFK